MDKFLDNDYLNQVYYHNTVLDYLIATGIITLGLLLIKIFKSTLLRKVKAWSGRSATHFDDYLVAGIERFGIPAMYYTIIYIGLSYLSFSQRGAWVLKIASTFVVTFLIIRLISSTILLLLQSYVRRQERGEEKVKQLGGLMLIINVFIWIIGTIFLFDNMGYNVTTVITGLGIGGIAIALAAQNILGDLFNYFVIFFDRPFETGDFVVVDDKNGVVDYVGIKTTRIQTLNGEQLVFSNSDLTNSRIHNFKRMEKRRVVFKLGVVYQTSLENLKAIPEVIKSIIETHENATFDRSHFVSYGDSSLDFETVYYVQSPEYNTYLDIHQDLNLRIFEAFSKRGIDFAYPTRTLFLTPENSGQRMPETSLQ